MIHESRMFAMMVMVLCSCGTGAESTKPDEETSIEARRASICCASCTGRPDQCITDCVGTCTAVDDGYVHCDADGNTLYCPPPPLFCLPFSIFLPNVFTPNGDGYNDSWIVADANHGTDSIEATNYDLTIVNRWGGQVYRSTGTRTHYYHGGDISWNGQNQGSGSLVSAGDYFHSLTLYDCNDVASTYNGWITVVY